MSGVPDPTMFLAAASSILFGIIVAVLIAVPFEGAMTRLRAQYAPKSISLDGEEARTNPELKGVFHSLRRTIALEGWSGVYKGTYPTLVAVVAQMLTMLAFMSWRGLIQPPEGAPPALSSVRMPTLLAASVNRSTVLSDQPRFDHIGTGVGLLLAFVFLPLTVIIKRAMVTPYKLSFSASTGLRVLLTRHERRRPWLLYLTPGLVAAEVLIAVCPFLLFTFMDSRIAPRDGLVRAIVFVAVMALSTAWVVPLKVVVNKVSVQGNLLSAAGEGEQELLLSEHHEDVDEDAAGVDRASSTDEDVLTIRPPLPKYRSLPDALRTIVDEEGWTALYRGWIWTFLSLVFGALGGIPTYRPHV